MPIPLYAGDSNYIRPLNTDIADVFNREKNPMFTHGECVRWLLQDDSGKYIGRIAAFYDEKTMHQNEQPTGGCGFFECIDDQAAANLLFDTAKKWLEEHGIEAMDGPINFGSREKWWGLLIDGFHQPCYCCNYNPSYYRALFENYGFQVYFKQFTYRRTLDSPLGNRIAEKAKKVLQESGYTFSYARGSLTKTADDFRKVYNGAWGNHVGVSLITEEGAQKILNSIKPILDRKILWFAYYQGEPVAFFISIPDVNQLIVKHLNGKLTLLGKLLFLWNKWTKNCKTMFGIVFGVVSDHQRKGVEAALVMAASEVIIHKREVKYQELQMNWVGDFNPKMMNTVRYIGGTAYKTHHTYRYLFDRTKPFERHPII